MNAEAAIADLPDKEVAKRFFLSQSIIRELEEHRRWAERILFFAGVISAGMAIPQVMMIFAARDSSQISLIAWSYYFFVNILWILYAYVFKRPVVKRVQCLYMISNMLVIGTTVYFRWIVGF